MGGDPEKYGERKLDASFAGYVFCVVFPLWAGVAAGNPQILGLREFARNWAICHGFSLICFRRER
jgi:hypothetical protein